MTFKFQGLIRTYGFLVTTMMLAEYVRTSGTGCMRRKEGNFIVYIPGISVTPNMMAIELHKTKYQIFSTKKSMNVRVAFHFSLLAFSELKNLIFNNTFNRGCET